MSAGNIRTQINQLREHMTGSFLYSRYSSAAGCFIVTENFFKDLNQLQQTYGEYLGKAKANHSEFNEQLTKMDDYINECLQGMLESTHANICFNLLNLAVGKISELVSFVDTLETIPPEEKVPKKAYANLLKEKEQLEKTAEFLVKHSNFQGVSDLLEKAKGIGLPVNRDWVLALCSVNLIEAIVNAKLESFGIKVENRMFFKDKYQKLCEAIKQKENGRDIYQLLPVALYEGIRNKLDHASNSHKVTKEEAEEISKIVIKFMNEVFTSKV